MNHEKKTTLSFLRPFLSRFYKKKNNEQKEHRSKKIILDEMKMREIALSLGLTIHEDLSELTIDHTLTTKVPYSFAKNHLILPLSETDESFMIATSNPLDLDAIETLKHSLKKIIETVFVPKKAIISAIHEYYHQSDQAKNIVFDEAKNNTDEEIAFKTIEAYDLLDDSQSLPQVVRLLNFVITEAVQQNASDIHFEPKEHGLLIRYRIDGVLQNRLSPAHELQTQLLTRLKVMAQLDIAEKRLPQDGRIKMRMGGKEVDFRVSTLPTSSGERIVLRILDKGNITLGLDKIGMPKQILDEFRKQIIFPEGIILVTGPTGSGKTTTLYSALSEIQDENTNIMTIEDPVEYRLKGISQMGVHPQIGLTFASGLRHILRQDPDVIMIGEIRDKETAEIAIQSALTGHLVLSTLHTNDAPSAIARLVDMGVEPYLLSSCLIGIMAQRLLRRLCPHCKVAYTPTEEDCNLIGITKNMLQENLLYKTKGCTQCFQSGFQGRLGGYELMTLTPNIRKQLLKSPEATELKYVAQKEGMQTLRESGLQIVLQGDSTIEEVWRVTRQDEEIQ